MKKEEVVFMRINKTSPRLQTSYSLIHYYAIFRSVGVITALLRQPRARKPAGLVCNIICGNVCGDIDLIWGDIDRI